jgi:hypothetical protein
VEAPRRAAPVAFPLAIARSVLAAPALSADTKPPEEDITPSTTVVRLNIAKGTSWVRPAGSGVWREEYSHNSPVGECSRVSIPRDSESEILAGGSAH